MRKFIFAAVLPLLLLAGCEYQAVVASRNLSRAADQFEIQRRIVFYNGITGQNMLIVEGRCALDLDRDRVMTVTCKEGPSQFVKHYLGLSDNVTYFAQQIELADVSAYHNRIIFRPQTVLPDFELDVSEKELHKDRY